MTEQYAWRIRRTDGMEYDYLSLNEDSADLAEKTPSLFELSIITWESDGDD